MINSNTNNAAFEFLQCSAVAQTMLGGITTYSLVNFLEYMFAKNYENLLTVDRSYCNIVIVIGP